jgi:hypothetical protein
LPESELKNTLKKSLALAQLKTRNPDDAERLMKQFSDAEIQSACVDILSENPERLGKLLNIIYHPVVKIEAYAALYSKFPGSRWLEEAKEEARGLGEFTLHAKALVVIARTTRKKEDIQKAWKAILELDTTLYYITQVTLLAELGKISHNAFKVAREKALEIHKEPRIRVKALLEIADRLAEVTA